MGIKQSLRERAKKSSQRDRMVAENFVNILHERQIRERSELRHTSNDPAIAIKREAVQAL